MYGIEIVTPAASEPISAALLKSHLRLNTTDEDTLLTSHCVAAREMFESMTERTCITTTYKMYMDAFPRVIRLPRMPLQSVTSVSYYDSTDNLVVWDSSKYSVDTKREPGRIVPKVWFPDWRVFPVYPPLSYKTSPKIVIEFVAGWTTLTLPSLVKQGLLLLASHYYENRSIQGKMDELPLGFRNIVNQYRSGWQTDMNPPMYGNYGYICE